MWLGGTGFRLKETFENWDAAALMARSALQAALRNHQAQGHSLKQEIDDLASKGILPPNMKDWSDHIRELGNDSAHPGPILPDPQDAHDIVSFLDFLLVSLCPSLSNSTIQRASRENTCVIRTLMLC